MRLCFATSVFEGFGGLERISHRRNRLSPWRKPRRGNFSTIIVWLLFYESNFAARVHSIYIRSFSSPLPFFVLKFVVERGKDEKCSAKKEINVNSVNILSCKCGIYERRMKCCNNLRRRRQGASGNFHLLEIVVGGEKFNFFSSSFGGESGRLSKRFAPRLFRIFLKF